MNHQISLIMVFLLAKMVICQKYDVIFTTNRDSISLFNRQLIDDNLIKSTVSVIGKRILLEYLASLLVRIKHGKIENNNKHSTTTFMHWRLG
jgi:hypothetical protein